MSALGVRSMGRTITNSMGSQKASAQEFLSNRAGSTLTSALYKNSSCDVLPTASPESSAYFMSELDKKSPDEVYNGYVASNYPELEENIKDPRAAGLEVKRHLQSLPPEIAYSNWHRAQTQGNLPKEGRQTFYQNSRDEVGTNRETVTAIQKGIYTPNLETLDTSPRFALDTFNTGTVTEKGAVANAKLFAGVKQLGTPEKQEVNRIAETKFRTAPPELLGKQLAQASGVKMTEKEQKTYGHAMSKVRDVVVKRNPALANNLAHYTFGRGSQQFTSLMNDEKFTSDAIKGMESHETSAWLANTLNVKQTEIPSIEKLYKTKPNTFIDKKATITNTPSKQVQIKQPKSKPIDLSDMQRLYFDEKR
jgi:DNA-binding XRE family transcriptional regulator